MATPGPSVDDVVLGGLLRRKRNLDDSMTGDEEKGNGGGTGDSINDTQPHGSGFHKAQYVFKHSRIMSTFGYQYQNIMTSYTDDFDNKFFYTTTPYAHVPCHGLPFYMSFTEYDNLPRNSKVKKCVVECKPIGYRAPFTTNSASTAQVNGSFMVHGMYAHGLNNKYQGFNGFYATDASNPCLPNAVGSDLLEGCDPNTFWGYRISGTNMPTYGNIGANFGKEIPILQYYTKLTPLFKDKVGEFLDNSFEDINLFTMNMATQSGPTVRWEYRPQVCVLKPPGVGEGTYLSHKSKYVTKLNFGAKLPMQYEYTYKKNVKSETDPEIISQDKFNTIDRHATSPTNTDPNYDFYKCYIKQCGAQTQGMTEYGGGLQPPSLHIGTLPLNTWYHDPDVAQCMPATTQWMINTEIYIESSLDFIEPYMSIQHPNAMVYTVPDCIKLGQYPFFLLGYKSRLETIATKKNPMDSKHVIKDIVIN